MCGPDRVTSFTQKCNLQRAVRSPAAVTVRVRAAELMPRLTASWLRPGLELSLTLSWCSPQGLHKPNVLSRHLRHLLLPWRSMLNLTGGRTSLQSLTLSSFTWPTGSQRTLKQTKEHFSPVEKKCPFFIERECFCIRRGSECWTEQRYHNN